TYSQFDNNDFGTYYDNGFGSFTQDQRDMWKQRNMERNGYAMGWVSNYIEKDADGNYQHNIGAGGEVAMDIYVHNGEAEIDVEFGTDGVGTSRSNPQVSVSNDISRFSKEGETFHPPTFDETTQSYDSTANAAYKAAINDGSAITDAQFGVVVNSMEISEVDPFALTAADVIWGDKTPTEIKNGAAKDHDGNDYIYADAFLDRSQYDLSTSDGGVIAGLAGQSSYDPEINNFGDQQVIRIDLPQSVLNSIDAIVFYDFGDSIVGAAGTQQTAPVAIRFDIIDGNLLYKVDPQDESTWVYFPENRIYIARVRDMVPEPTSLVLLALGSTMIMARRTRRRR
ncbi:MAG: PEP-CTERM sorting domain-containing protein, partial [Phycisphaerae bacterium]|nr:PEP-CTERM sorting domain-containing protein [Phycisphaerae bacterium]